MDTIKIDTLANIITKALAKVNVYRQDGYWWKRTSPVSATGHKSLIKTLLY
jgi:hypothetical protein